MFAHNWVRRTTVLTVLLLTSSLASVGSAGAMLVNPDVPGPAGTAQQSGHGLWFWVAIAAAVAMVAVGVFMAVRRRHHAHSAVLPPQVGPTAPTH